MNVLLYTSLPERRCDRNYTQSSKKEKYLMLVVEKYIEIEKLCSQDYKTVKGLVEIFKIR